jgi:hypothetical protein
MPIPTITALPVPPSRSDATNFASRGDAFLGALPTFQSEMNAAAVAINAVYFPPVFRNLLISGDFSIWQRGTSQTSDAYASDDRWLNRNEGSTKTHSQQAFTLGQTAVPGEPRFFSRTVVASVAGAGNCAFKLQRIEGVRTLAGRNARVSFWAKADAARPIAIDFRQIFGLGGSAAIYGIGAQKFNLTTSWQKFAATVAIPSISGKTIGTALGNDCLEVAFWFDAGSNLNARTASLGQQSGTFDIALVQVEEGAVDTTFEVRPPGLELALCQRYYCTGDAGPTGQGEGGALSFYGYALNGTEVGAYAPFPVTMRATPAVATQNQYNSGFPVAVGLITPSPRGFYERRTANSTGVNRWITSWQADAEL